MAAGFVGMAFIPYFNHLMQILDTDEELKKTAKGIFKQVAWTAGGTAVGGIFAGPFGAMAGGMAGSCIGYFYSSDYESLVAVIRNLTDDEKAKIVHKVQELVGSTSLEALTHFIGAQVQREALLNLLRQFATGVKSGG
ncbi:protein C19orf12 homolog [Littorina saxatilis]|uniref:Uncharacterized protein n=1 Tax=Littorina saxatilis TaxID=31220 RepID=A0AAN9BPG9_9CAEN